MIQSKHVMCKNISVLKTHQSKYIVS